MKKLVKDWDEKEIKQLRQRVEQELCHLDIIDIRVCGSYCWGGGSRKDLDLVVIVDNVLEPDDDDRRQLRYPLKSFFKGIPLDIWIYEKNNRRCEIFAINDFEFDLPWYSIVIGKHNVGKDLEKWRKAKREGLTKIEMRGDRVWNGTLINSKRLKLVKVEGGIGGILK